MSAETGDDATLEEKAPERPLAWLERLPVGTFSIAMGIAGLSLAWRWADGWTPTAIPIGNAIMALAVCCYLATLAAYALKIAHFRDAFMADVKDPGASNFISAITMTPMLFAAVALDYWPGVAEPLWFSGALLHLLVVIRQIQFWITRNFEIKSTSPAWFIPISGCLLAPITGIKLGYTEISWLLFSLGLGFWIALFVIVLNRVIFHDQLPARYVPTLFLLMTPPSLAFTAYCQITDGHLDSFGRFLYHFALSASLLVFAMSRLFTRLPFSITWWAYTFPLGAFTQASFLYAELAGSQMFRWGSIAFLLFTTTIVVLVFVKTVDALRKGTLFEGEEH